MQDQADQLNFGTPPKKNKKRGPLRRTRYGGWLIYVWLGMQARVWRQLLAKGRYDYTANTFLPIVAVTLWTPMNTLLGWISEAIYRRRAEAVTLDQPPIFVVGHWRSGTTLLHDLLACDTRYGVATTYSCFLPSHFLLTERALGRVLNLLLPKKRPQDDVPVSMQKPQEEEFALLNLGAGTPYSTMAWPRHGPADEAYLDLLSLSEADRQAWIDTFLWFFRRLTLKHGGKPLILKAPTHAARIRTLLRLFPDARFIHLARNPLEVIPSTVRLWRALYSTEGLHNPPRLGWLDAHVLDTFLRLTDRYDADRGLIPASNLVEIRYEELAADPKRVLRQVYDALNLGEFAAVEPDVDRYLSDRREHKRAEYDLPRSAIGVIAARLSGYIQRFGYTDDVERALFSDSKPVDEPLRESSPSS